MEVNRIIHGDALDVLAGLPDASVDAIITDPPYGVGKAEYVALAEQRLSEMYTLPMFDRAAGGED